MLTTDGAIQPELLEAFVRDELNKTAPRSVYHVLVVLSFNTHYHFLRAMAVLDPIRVVITNFQSDEV